MKTYNCIKTGLASSLFYTVTALGSIISLDAAHATPAGRTAAEATQTAGATTPILGEFVHKNKAPKASWKDSIATNIQTKNVTSAAPL